MDIVKVDSFDVTGIAVRTDNASETDPTTAKIASLWEQFYSELAPKLDQKARVFGLYTHYESDHTGLFDVVACSDSLAPLDSHDLSRFQIHSGDYLVFRGTGEMPKVVFDLWSQVWEYFSVAECEHKRAFTTDFELYKSHNEIEIYIAIERSK